MRFCLRPLLAPTPSTANNHCSPPTSHGNSVDNTQTSSVQLSPTVNLSQEYALAIRTHSYGEICRTFDQVNTYGLYVDTEHSDLEEPQLLEQVLRPSHECVIEVLSQIRPSPLTHLLATYFEHSEDASRLCLLLYQRVHHARLLYDPVHELLDDLPHNADSYFLSHAQCTLAFNVFLQFDHIENPFSTESYNFHNIRQSFSQLRQQLDHHLRKSQSRVPFIRRCSTGSALCLIAASVGVVVSAVAKATNALVAIVASPICPSIFPTYRNKREMLDLAQLDAAAKGTYFLHNDLDTIDRLVARLNSAVENDKLLIHVGLERDVEKHPIQEVLRQLERNRSSFIQQLVDLEEHLFLCFAAINRARSLLLQEIQQNGHHV